MELQCKFQNYDWGKLGRDSVVAKLLSSANPNLILNENEPFAELWMGTHPNGPSMITERNILISEYLKDNHDAIGPTVKKKFGIALPFLLKVLSIRKALSIQAHPNQEHAQLLHNAFPEMYKDPNHKPELAIALTPFEALCGFRPLNEIKEFLKKLPELTEILTKQSVQTTLTFEEKGDSEQVIKSLFSSLMTVDKEAVSSAIYNLLKRLENEDDSTKSFLLYPIIKKLQTDFPGDIGVWSPYIMNYLVLRPGQAIYLKSNLPHAYLSGDCVECMACSDNVVRAGLTPKHIDVPTLIDMLDYKSYTASELLFNPQIEDENSCIWRPPVEDFAVVKISVPSGDVYNTPIRPSPSIILIISGNGTLCDTEPIIARPGTVVFLKCSRQLTITPEENSNLIAYQAICNV